jgi:hypothetical protein
VTLEDDSDQAAPSPRQRKIIHIDMDAFYASEFRMVGLLTGPVPAVATCASRRENLKPDAFAPDELRLMNRLYLATKLGTRSQRARNKARQ